MRGAARIPDERDPAAWACHGPQGFADASGAGTPLPACPIAAPPLFDAPPSLAAIPTPPMGLPVPGGGRPAAEETPASWAVLASAGPTGEPESVAVPPANVLRSPRVPLNSSTSVPPLIPLTVAVDDVCQNFHCDHPVGKDGHVAP